MANKSATQAGAAAGRCPICRSPTDAAYRPFCSARCRDVDLSRWLGGGYAIPGSHAAADEDGEDRAARSATPEGGEDDEDRS
jgi:endogenous inhibitor of DNA gyrase (YacG/DUF329 family)